MQRNKQVGDVAYVPDKSPSDTDEDFETESCLKPPSGIDNHLPIPTSSEVEAGLAVGATVELKDGSFIRICELMIPKTPRAARLSGELFRRACDFPDWVPTAFGLNELIMIREAKKDEMTDNSKFMRTATMDEAKRIRQLIMINSPEMDVALQGEYQIFLDQIDGQSSVPAPLFYRWRFVAELSRSSTTTSRRTAQSLETAKELTKALLLYSNTGIHHHEQSSSKKKRGLTDANPRPSKRSHISSISAGSIPHNKKTYAFADAFCGAGGMSRAAHEASFQIIWAFDQDSLATTAYQSNFPGATTHTIEASELVSEQSKYYAPTVDVLHISPPCQAFATAQRTPGPNNEANAACLHMVAPLIEKVNPRIVTLEEVPGLRSDHPADFAQLVKSITSLNYSITWTIMKCVEHGLPQRRKRLFMLASRCGEPLPDFPKPTHRDGNPAQQLSFPGLNDCNTMSDAIDNIPIGTADHRPIRSSRRWPATPAYDGNAPLHETLKCSHWPRHYSGQRVITVREGACLKCFPYHHTFAGGIADRKRQIGNAVPPSIGKLILEEVMRTLMRADGLEGDECVVRGSLLGIMYDWRW